MKKLLEAVPNTLILVGGIGLVILLLSPFLMEMIGDRPKHGAITLHEDSENLPGLEERPESEPGRTGRTLQLLPEAQLFNRHAGLTLGDPPAKLEERFHLRLISRDGAQPQIYEAYDPPDIDYLQVSFYDGQLREFVVVYPPRPGTPENLANELFAEFGQVPAWLRDREEESIHVGQVTSELTQKLAPYPAQRHLAWSDGDHRVDATVYSRPGPDGQPVAVLAVQVRAAQWLKDYHAKRESGITATLPDKPKTDAEPSGPPPPPM